jgi:hypothetical protein
LAISIFYSIQKIIKSETEWQRVLKPLFWASTITALFLVLSSLPFTRFIVNPIFGIGFLEPASDGVVEEFLDEETAKRGRSLVGVSILSGAFINAAWPLLLGLRFSRIRFGRRLKKYLPIVMILMPLSVFMTYSRGAILGSILVFVVMQIFNTGKYRAQILAILSVGFIVVNYIGLDSDYFYTARLETSINRTLTEGSQSQNERETKQNQ